MAVQIISGASADTLIVDPTSKAARVTLYDTAGNPISNVRSLSNILNALNASVQIALGGQTTVGFGVTGTAGTLTLSFEATIDNINWFAISATPVALGAAVTSTSTNGDWVASVGGYLSVRARISAFTSGSMSVSMVVSPGDTATVAQVVTVATLPLPTGASTASNQTTLGAQTTKINDGTNTAAVKPASTPPLATDPALVVSVSPNSSITITDSSIGVNGAALPGSSTLVGGSDGTNLQPLQVESSANKNLRVGLYSGANEATVTGANALKVDGSAVTQPVSAASLPLPTGAATSANQTTLGSQTTKINDGTNTAAVTAASALKVDGSAVTQPVSGSVTVSSPNAVDSNNSSVAPLGSNAVFTGTATDVTGFAQVEVSVFADQDSATNGLSVQFSTNGTNWDDTQQRSVTASTVAHVAVNPTAKFFRVVYTNGTSAQGAFRLQAILRSVSGNGTVSTVDQLPVTGDNALLTQSVLVGKTTGGGGGYVAVKVAPSGTLTVDASGSTVPVSAASLPLPTGASTSANQTNGNQQTQIVQGGNTAAVTGASALKVDGSAVTQPVSAASLPLPTGAATAANQTTLGSQTTKINDGTHTAAVTAASALVVDGSAVTQPVSAASLPLPTGAATETTLAKIPVGQGSTTSGQSGPLSQGAVTTGAPAYTNGQTSPLSLTTAGNLRTDGSTVTQPVSAVSLPLPTGAATSANQTTVGSQTTKINDGTNTAAVTGANALKVDGSAVTQPVSGTVTANQGTAAATAGAWPTKVTDGTNTASVSASNALKVDGSAVTQPVSATSLPLPTGAATSANQTTLGSQTTKINDGTNTAAVSAANALKVDGSAVTQPVSAASLPLPTGASTAANQTTVGSQTTKLNDGTNTAAVKAASTLAVAADPALVVALSPNNTPFAFGGDNRLRVGQESLIFYDTVEGTTIDLNRWTQSQSGMTQAQASANLTLNSGSSTTTGNYSILTSAKQALVTVEFPIYVQFRARIVFQTNAVEELGFGFAATTATPTDGVFFRVDSTGALKGVINFGGTETLTATIGSIVTGTFYNFEVTVYEDHAVFEVSSADGATNFDVSLPIPSSQGSPTSAGHLPVFARVYNSGTPGAAAQIIIASVSAQQMDLDTGKSWPEQMASIGRSALYDPSTFAQTTNYTNNTLPAAATLSNTAAGYTTLGGLFRFATVAGAETDYALFAYQVPTGAMLYVYKVSIHSFVTGAASAGTTPILLQWALAANSSAVSLATGAPNPPFFFPIGMQQVQRSAAIGDSFIPGELLYLPRSPLIVNPSRFLHIVVRIPTAAALATQFIRGMVTVEGVFE